MSPAGRAGCWSQREGGAGVARQPDRPVQETGGCRQLGQYLFTDAGTGAGEGPRDRGPGAPDAASAADGRADSTEFAGGQDLADERQRIGFLVGEVTGQPGPQPDQQLAEPLGV